MSIEKWLGVGAGVMATLVPLAVYVVETLDFSGVKHTGRDLAVVGGIATAVLGTGYALGGKTSDTFGRGMMYGVGAIPALMAVSMAESVVKGRPLLSSFGGEKPCPVLLAAKNL